VDERRRGGAGVVSRDRPARPRAGEREGRRRRDRRRGVAPVGDLRRRVEGR
jgi:hypothetical protein